MMVNDGIQAPGRPEMLINDEILRLPGAETQRKSGERTPKEKAQYEEWRRGYSANLPRFEYEFVKTMCWGTHFSRGEFLLSSLCTRTPRAYVPGNPDSGEEHIRQSGE
jgi:hypothetical protein